MDAIAYVMRRSKPELRASRFPYYCIICLKNRKIIARVHDEVRLSGTSMLLISSLRAFPVMVFVFFLFLFLFTVRFPSKVFYRKNGSFS